jgi:hypothetical protein
MDRRRYVRYQLSANAVFTWKGSGRAYLHAEGFTRDISPLGAFILSSSCPPVASAVQLDLFIFSSAKVGGPPSLRIRAEARVLRIEYTERGTIQGFSVSCSRLRFWPRKAIRYESAVSNSHNLFTANAVQDLKSGQSVLASYSGRDPGPSDATRAVLSVTPAKE